MTKTRRQEQRHKYYTWNIVDSSLDLKISVETPLISKFSLYQDEVVLGKKDD